MDALLRVFLFLFVPEFAQLIEGLRQLPPARRDEALREMRNYVETLD